MRRSLSWRTCLLVALSVGSLTACDDGGSPDDGGVLDAGPPPLATCGNGTLDEGEACDGDLLGGATCASEGLGGGALSCASTCRAFDTSGCDPSCTPDCGGLECGPDPVCGSDCGSCVGDLTCGGGSAAGRCGASCEAGCPAGFACDDLGVCRGGDLGTLVIDVPVRTVTASVTVNGAALVPRADCSSRSNRAGRLTFTPAGSEASITALLPCDGSAVRVELSPGSYEVTAQGVGSNLPDPVTVIGALEVTSDATEVFDVAVRRITAGVTVNGAPIVPSADCASQTRRAGRLTFVVPDTEASIAGTVPCDGSPIEVDLAQGHYEVRAQGDASNLPDPVTPIGSLEVTTDATETFDVAVRRVSAAVTVNGAPLVPTADCAGQSRRAGRLTFRVPATGATTPRTVPCDGSAIEIELAEGSYEVLVQGLGSNLPDPVTLVRSLTVTADATETFDVPVRTLTSSVTVNGAPLVPTSDCASLSRRAGRLTMQIEGTDSEVSSGLACDGSPVVRELSPGTYQLRVQGLGSNLPDIVTEIGSFTVTSDASETFDVAVRSVSMNVTVNGAPRVPTSDCASMSRRAGQLSLRVAETEAAFATTLPCDGSSVSRELSPGTYEVLAAGLGSNLPDAPSVIGSLEVTADAAETFDATVLLVAPRVTVNGAPLVPTADCSSRSRRAGELTFRDRDRGGSVTAILPCDGAPQTPELSPGSFEVTVQGVGSNLPDVQTVGVTRLGVE